MTKPLSLSVFFPAYNEGKNIRQTVLKAKETLDKLKITWEIIVVDDGSKDETLKESREVSKLDKRIRVVHQENGGYGAALSRGFSEAKYELVVYTDSDGQFDFKEINKFLEASKNADVVWGYRKDRNDPWFRKIFGLMWRIPSRILLGVTLRDADCGFKLFRRKVVSSLTPLSSKRGAMINVEIAVKAKQNGFTVTEVGVSHYPRVFGAPSGYSLRVVFRSYLDLLKMWTSLGIARPYMILGTLVLIGLGSILTPFVYWPEMLNWPFFMLSGWLPYRDIAIVHTPLLLWVLEFIYRIFGLSATVLHVFGTMILIVSSWLIYKFSGGKHLSGVVGALVFGSLSLAFQGNTIWFESALTPILLLALFLMEKSLISPKVSFAIGLGLTLSGGFWIKQTTLFLMPALLLFFVFLFRKFNLRALLFVFIIGAIFGVAGLIMLAIFSGMEVLRPFYYWAVQFVFLKMGSASGEFSYVLFPTVFQTLILGVFILCGLFIWLKNRNSSNTLLLTFFICSLLFSFPRFEYFHLIPALGFMGMMLSRLNYRKSYVAAVMLVIVGMGILVFWRTNKNIHTFVDADSILLAKVINEKYPGKSVFVFNGPDELYFLSRRTPAVKPWVPQLPWYFHYYGDNNFFRDFSVNPPDLIIMRPFLKDSIHGLGAYRTEPTADYIGSEYKLAERIDSNLILIKR